MMIRTLRRQMHVQSITTSVPTNVDTKNLIKFEKILAYEVEDMIGFHQLALKENEDKEFNRREEMEKMMATLKEIELRTRHR